MPTSNAFSVAMFWLLCALAAAAHPLILRSYARLFTNRKRSIDALYESTTRRKAGGDPDSLGGVLRDVYEKESNWRGFFVPVAMCSVLSFGGAAVMIESMPTLTGPLGFVETSPLSNYLEYPNATAVLGFAGAYLASLYSLIDRFRSLTLSTFVLHLAWFRLLFGAAMGALMPSITSSALAPLVAFGSGFLPLRELIEVLTRAARRAFGTEGAPRPQQELTWDLVQGASPDIVERLEEADVTSVAALASQNPIALMHRTNIAWRVLLDLMDQAILITYVQDKIKELRAIGVRGAIEAGIVYLRVGATGTDGTIPVVASILGRDEACARNLMRNLSEDAQVRLLHELWFDTADDAPARVAGIPQEAGPGPDGARLDTLWFSSKDGLTEADMVAALQRIDDLDEVVAVDFRRPLGTITMRPGADRARVIDLLTQLEFSFVAPN